jgi:hypothetical protein
MFRFESALAGAAAGALTFLGLHLLVPGQATDTDRSAGAELAEAFPRPSSTVATPADDERVGALETDVALRIASLQAQIQQLERRLDEGSARTPVAAAEAEALAEELVLGSDLAALGTPDQQRALVLQVLADERDRQERERETERQERELARSEERADRVAEALDLSAAQRDALAAVYRTESESRAAMMDRLRDIDPADRGARDTLRDDFRGLRDATRGEIELRLGVDTARRIQEYDEQNDRGFGGFGGFGDRGDRGGRGGFGG